MRITVKRLRLLIACGFLILGTVLLAPYAWQRIERWGVGVHHRSTTNELAGWERGYGHIQNSDEADRAIDMLGYVQHYYVPASGYRSDEETEANLAAQRSRTARAITDALKEFTGQDFGADADEWREGMREVRYGKSPVKRQGRPAD